MKYASRMSCRQRIWSQALRNLAGSLNLMAERLMRMGQGTAYAQRLLNALGDLCLALERTAFGTPLIIPESCNELTEINRLLVALRIKRTTNPQSNFESRQQVQSFTPMAPMTSKTPPGPLPPVLPALHSDMHAIKPTPRTPTPVQNHHPITQPLTLGSSGSPTSNADGTARYKGQRPAHNILGVRPSPTPPNTNPYRQEHRGD